MEIGSGGGYERDPVLAEKQGFPEQQLENDSGRQKYGQASTLPENEGSCVTANGSQSIASESSTSAG